jgi:hypothetical protein
VAVVLFNRNNVTENITASWREIGLDSRARMSVRDLWVHETVASAQTMSYTGVDVPPHGCVMIKLSPATAVTREESAVDEVSNAENGDVHEIREDIQHGIDGGGGSGTALHTNRKIV